MQSAQQGDLVRVHYRKRFEDGLVASSHKREPLELTVGIDHPRLPGLGLALVGLTPGTSTRVHVPSEQGYGPPDPTRVHRWPRTRFSQDQTLRVGTSVCVLNRRGRRRLVRILELRGETVVVDTNYPGAGQAMDVEVKLLGIQTRDAAV